MSMEPQDRSLENLSREELLSAIFANMVSQNTNMTLMLLGRVPHPETGERVTDLEAARIFIDQLEMLEVKTKGNLTKEEDRLLQQSLTHVRLAFVEAVEQPGEKEKASKAEVASQPTPTQPAKTPAEPEAESHKRFTKKY